MSIAAMYHTVLVSYASMHVHIAYHTCTQAHMTRAQYAHNVCCEHSHIWQSVSKVLELSALYWQNTASTNTWVCCGRS